MAQNQNVKKPELERLQAKYDARGKEYDASLGALKAELQELKSFVKAQVAEVKAEIKSTGNGPKQAAGAGTRDDNKAQVEANVLRECIDDVKQELDRIKVLVKPFEETGAWEVCWNQVQELYPEMQTLKQDVGALEKQSARSVGGSSGSNATASDRQDLHELNSKIDYAILKQGDAFRVIDALTQEITANPGKRERTSTQDKTQAIATKEEVARDLDKLKAEVLAELETQLQSHSSEIRKAVVEPQTAFGNELRKLSDVFSTIESLTSNAQDSSNNVGASQRKLQDKMGTAASSGEAIPATILQDLKQATMIALDQKGLFLDNKTIVDAAVEDIKRFRDELAEHKEKRRQASSTAKNSGSCCMSFLG